MTEKECVAMGGHCWMATGLTLLCDPPIIVQRCKHCGKERHGQEQPMIKWSEP